MPKKIRELKAMLRKVGIFYQPGKGSHTAWKHPALAEKVVLAGADGDDAKPYQEKDAQAILKKPREEQE